MPDRRFSGMEKIRTLGRLASRELIRDRVLYSSVLAAIVLLLLMFFVSKLTFERPDRVVVSLGLAVVRLGMAAIAVLLASGLVPREYSRGTALTILSRPVTRLQMATGLYFGLVRVLFMNWILVSGALAGTLVLVGGDLTPALGLALAASLAECLVLGGVALVVSSFASQAVSVTVSTGILLIGSNVSQLLYLKERSEGALSLLLGLAASVTPDLERFQLTENVVYSIPLSMPYVLGLAAYALVWVAALLVLSGLLLSRRPA